MTRRHSTPRHPELCSGRGCDAQIWFKQVTVPNQAKPLLLPLRAEPSDAGTVAAAPDRDWQPGRFLGKDDQPDAAQAELRWVNHFDDCPDAKEFKRRENNRRRENEHTGRRRAAREAREPGEPAQLALPISGP